MWRIKLYYDNRDNGECVLKTNSMNNATQVDKLFLNREKERTYEI